jgi:hypothetical protein
MPTHWPFYAFYPFAYISALVCSIIAAFRGNKSWLLFSATNGILAAGALLATIVEC